MIPAILIFGGFLGISIALVLIQPTAGPGAPSDDLFSADVTRSGSMLDGLAETAAPQGKGGSLAQPDGSLAFTAYRFHGRTSYTDEIYRANHDRLGSGGERSVGQPRAMPAL